MPRLVVYTEDSGKGGAVVVQALVERLLFHLAKIHEIPQVDTAQGQPAAAAHAFNWKERSARGEAARRALVRDLVTRFSEGTFVVFHYDGDVPWSDAPTTSKHDVEVAALFEEVRRNIRTEAGSEPLPFVPHYSIEAWLYLHEKVVAKLVFDKKAAQATEPWMTANRRPETGFDHVFKPKDACPLGDAFNDELARSYPVPRCMEQSPSLRRTVDAWAARADLRALLGIAD